MSVTPDISIFAKAMASGYPISAVVGRREWMKVIEDSEVIHAGTMNSGNPSVAAALATIEVLETEKPYQRMFDLGSKLMDGLRAAGASYGHQLLVQGPGPVFHIGFSQLREVKDFRDTLSFDKVKLGRFIAGMHDRKIRVIGRGLWYISAAHTEEDVDKAIDVASEVLQMMR